MESLCWKCKKSCGGENGCSWFNGFIPVEGWKAKENCKGYLVETCPLFIPDDTRQRPLIFLRDPLWYPVKVEELADKLGISLRTLFRKDDITLKQKAFKKNLKLEIFGKPPKRAFYIKEINDEVRNSNCSK